MSTGDWEKFTKEQQQDIDALRKRIGDHAVLESEAFYQQHPELKLTWQFTLDGLIRGVDHADEISPV